MTEYRFQDAVEEIVRSTLFCAQEASDDWVPLLFLAFLCRHQATLDALSQAGFDVERFEQANQAWLSKAEDVCRKVESCEAMTLADLPEFDAIEDAGVVSWLANAGIHVMSAGRRDRVVDVYDILIAIKTVMSAGSVISQAWDQAGVTLAELRRRDAVLHGPQGFYTLTPPATTGFMADFLDDFLFGGPDEEARNEEVEEGEEGEGAATAGTESWGEVVADGRGGKVVRINLHDGDEVPEAFKKMIFRLADRVAGSDSGDEPENQAEAVETDKPRAKGLSREEKYLQGCTRDLSAAAAGGELDPLIGRDAEVLRICEILCCRRKNKPLILGETGAGKTALVDLLLRTYNVPDGTLFVDGKDVNRVSIRSVRQACAYVPQDNFLFSDTIAHNIAFGVDEASPEDIERAARLADVRDNIVDFKDGYETVLGERGVTVSGGQKQRISIARALLKDAPILILDDSVSAVDTRTEKIILDNLKKSRAGKTTLLIAHRISTVEGLDKIVFLEDGRVEAVGPHDQLYASCPEYRRMVDLQKLEDEVGGGNA